MTENMGAVVFLVVGVGMALMVLLFVGFIGIAVINDMPNTDTKNIGEFENNKPEIRMVFP